MLFWYDWNSFSPVHFKTEKGADAFILSYIDSLKPTKNIVIKEY